MEYRFILMETGSRPEIFKVQLNMTARLFNQYPDRKVAVIERAELQSRSAISIFATEPSPEIAALRKRISELTEDRVETFIP